ncbi:cell wall-active antibiotics response protein LiaF [Cohnella lubricantis]|uniref:Cell wall-active antibiotics response protein n=1 Tax=Cohnella lubricantis TaxID=2163172 RepID=A0A841TFR9_9BACL|nr:cell wall-active antibiotics response protein LiaF [Cohnella lubricantis]MBB6678128.1 cell wall-active antibiotics response protein [Cohnella lubricantis]MBP2116699.1 lia operon protein LiaF [Cohnella lubricantis]
MQQSTMNRIIWGLIMVGVGTVFLLNQTGTISIGIGEFLGLFWPVFPILFGIQGLLIQRKGGFCWNSIVILAGVFFLGRNLGLFDWDIGDIIRIIAPVMIIIWGLRMLVRTGGRTRPDHQTPEGWNSVTPPIPPAPPVPPAPHEPQAPLETTYDRESPNPARAAASGTLPPPPISSHYQQPPWRSGTGFAGRENHSRFIGDFVIGQEYFELRPMSISHFIGDTKLDLTRAQIPYGETRIYVSTFIGDVKVFVPEDYSFGVRVVSSSLIGDVKVMEQKRGGLFNQINVETPSFMDASKQVVLVVSTFIGDVRVTKVG